jgi:hypothetical protein
MTARLRLCYSDPPYPGRAELYVDHPDYGGEVDHRVLIEDLGSFDGWALSTSAAALRDLLPLCPPEVRVLAWTKHTIGISWEPVIVRSARPVRGVRDWLECEPEAHQWRARPAGHVIGAKPEPFCRWIFQWLGAEPEDELVDLFPGSGAVGRAWDRWRAQPELPILAPSRSAEGRAQRRTRDRLLADHPRLDGFTGAA